MLKSAPLTPRKFRITYTTINFNKSTTLSRFVATVFARADQVAGFQGWFWFVSAVTDCRYRRHVTVKLYHLRSVNSHLGWIPRDALKRLHVLKAGVHPDKWRVLAVSGGFSRGLFLHAKY